VEPDPRTDARDLVQELFPHARWAVLGGSVVTAARTAGSDLDIVVLLPDDDPQAPHRDSQRYRGWPVELFVHDRKTLDHYLGKDIAERRPTLHRMLAGGVPVHAEPGEDVDEVQQRCRAVLGAGPTEVPADELAWQRYSLTDLLDDLVHSVDPGETAVIAADAWQATAALALDVARHWRGRGKWLVREVRDLDPVFADRWLRAERRPEAIADLAREILNAAGGPMFEGYRVQGTRP
jgi:hypothetical protein